MATVAASGVSAGLPSIVGKTPLLRLHKLSESTGCEILAKAEWMNPGGSVKDRAALGLITAAEKKGKLMPGGTVVEGQYCSTDLARVPRVAAVAQFRYFFARDLFRVVHPPPCPAGTAGNTGIGLAHICNARGYRLVIYMPNTQSQEKMDLLRVLGAEVRAVPAVAITDKAHYTFQARDYAASLPNGFWANQFDNTGA